jgi:hypothetical protein
MVPLNKYFSNLIPFRVQEAFDKKIIPSGQKKGQTKSTLMRMSSRVVVGKFILLWRASAIVFRFVWCILFYGGRSCF